MPDMAEPAGSQGEELLNLRNYVTQLTQRHNGFVQDVTKEFFSTSEWLKQFQVTAGEHERKLSVTESLLGTHDQRIQSNDVWLKSVCKDMADNFKLLMEKADAARAEVDSKLLRVDQYIDTNLTIRVEDLENKAAGLIKEAMAEVLHEDVGLTLVKESVVTCLNQELAPRLVSLTAEAAEHASGQLLSRVVALEVNAEGVMSDLKALGVGFEGIRGEGAQVADKVMSLVKATAETAEKLQEVAKGVSNKGAIGTGGDPWQAGYGTGLTAGPKSYSLSPEPGAAGCGPFSVAAGNRVHGGGGAQALQDGWNTGQNRPLVSPPGLKGEDFGRITMASKLFEEKTALAKNYQYDGVPLNNGHEWRSDVFDYFISKCPAAGPWLRWAEEKGSAEISGDDVSRTLQDGELMTDDLNPLVLSHHVWAFL